MVHKKISQLSPCYSRSATSTAEVDIDIGPGFQDSADADANANFDDVQNTASELTDRIREDNLPKDMGFAPTEAIVTIQPTAPAEEPPPIGTILKKNYSRTKKCRHDFFW